MTDLPAVPESSFVILRRAEEFQEIIKVNLGNQGIGGVFNLDRVKVPTGGATTWAVPGLGGEEYVKEIEGVIIYQRPNRSYWEQGFDERTTKGPPDCQSNDMMMGHGNPGGSCATCPYNEWGSHPTRDSKACRETKMLFLIREDEVLPMLIIAPPGSLTSVRKYFMRVTSKLLNYYDLVTSLTLIKATDNKGNEYAVIVPDEARRLEGTEAVAMKQVADFYEPFLTSVPMEPGDLAE